MTPSPSALRAAERIGAHFANVDLSGQRCQAKLAEIIDAETSAERQELVEALQGAIEAHSPSTTIAQHRLLLNKAEAVLAKHSCK